MLFFALYRCSRNNAVRRRLQGLLKHTAQKISADRDPLKACRIKRMMRSARDIIDWTADFSMDGFERSLKPQTAMFPFVCKYEGQAAHPTIPHHTSITTGITIGLRRDFSKTALARPLLMCSLTRSEGRRVGKE